mmetsp:Transcript_515/g.1403  ORF Transcript_515/g.1403 Transcript_515/m.1403 type:complete len:236 (-) Transcript_515:439-1146(-)
MAQACTTRGPADGFMAASCGVPFPSTADPRGIGYATALPTLPGDPLAYGAAAPGARSDDAEVLLAAEMDELSRVLQECHLNEGDVCGASPAAAPAAAPSQAGKWAEELVRQLQSCSSPEQGQAICAEALAAFHKHQAGMGCGAAGACTHAERLGRLQGANKVLVRALRAFLQRQAAAQARARQAEEANVRLMEQLRQCQEQLQASERAKANLQSHLQLMNSNLSESVALSHHAGL